MFTKTLVAALALTASIPALAQTSDLLAIGVHASILEQAVQIDSQSSTTPIDRYVSGIYTTGMAVTTVNVAQGLLPVDGAFGLQLQLSSYTNTATFSQTQPRPTILVNFNATIDTWGTTFKQVYLTESGFSLAPAQSTAQSQITFHDLQTSSWGLFWRLKDRIAYEQAQQQLMAQRAQQEAEASAEIAAQLNRNVDDRTWAMIAPLDALYREKFYAPIIAAGGLAGRTHFATSSDRFTLTANANAAPLALVSAAVPVEARLGDALVSRIVSSRIAGRTMTGKEIFLAVAQGVDPQELGDAVDLDGLAAISWSFAAQESTKIRFAKDRVELDFQLRTLGRGAQKLENVVVTVPAALVVEDETILLDLDQELAIRASDGRALSEDEVELAKELVRAVIPPVTLELSGRKVELAKMTLAIAALEASKGELHLTLKAVKAGGAGVSPTSPDSPNAAPVSELVAWCAAAGGSWRAPGADGHASCDCGSMWYRDDAMSYYGEADFTGRCRSHNGIIAP